jgi:DNA-binding transcriptional ArsR family regulator
MPVKDEPMSLSEVLDALRDPTRREIILRLSSQPRLCATFGDLGSKTKMSYHFAKLRKAGLTQTQKQGTYRLISLRAHALEKSFPGLLKAVLRGVSKESIRQK